MKNQGLIVVVVLVVLVLLYLGRNSIKTMLGMSPSASPVAEINQTPGSPTASTAPGALATPGTPGSTVANNIYKWTADAAGKALYLTDFQGKSLYIFDKDTTGVSNCTGPCATTWPAYSSGATAQAVLPKDITVITRSDGYQQFTWDGQPLYYYSGDKAVGDVNGDGVNHTWHLVIETK